MRARRLLAGGLGAMAMMLAGCAADEPAHQPLPRLTTDIAASVVALKGRPHRPLGDGSSEITEGSGFIVSADGLIGTSILVPGALRDLHVELPDGRSLPVQLVGQDTVTGVALLRVDAAGLRPVRFGSALSFHAGDTLLAAGRTPQGRGTGFTSLPGKVTVAPPAYDPAWLTTIQTEMTLAPAMTGGPLLVPSTGEVVGINAGWSVRLADGYRRAHAIPIETLLTAREELIAHGRVRRGTVGLVFKASPSSHAQQPSSGIAVTVHDTVPRSAAEKAGIQPGDAIILLEGRPVSSERATAEAIRALKPGSTLRLRVNRNAEIKDIELVVGEEDAQRSRAEIPSDLDRFAPPRR